MPVPCGCYIVYKRDQLHGVGVSCIKLNSLICCAECYLMSYLFTHYLAMNTRLFLHATRDMKLYGLNVMLIEATLVVLYKLGKIMPRWEDPLAELVHLMEDAF